MSLAGFHPLVATWFTERFGAPTSPQRDGWPHVSAGTDTLIAAPTGSGKTLAAFLWCVDQLLTRALSGELGAGTVVLYISPLKALGNDVAKNLLGPLAELSAAAEAAGHARPDIRVAVRTGDTPSGERAKMAKSPPHILVTTPESLYILLTTDRGRAALSTVRTVIVDEIHAVAPDKRGAHLVLSLERLDDLVASAGGTPPQRIGLSATQRPIELVAQMLVGARPLPAIVDSGFAREIDLAVEVPEDELGAVTSHEMMGELYDRIAALTEAHGTTLVFVNTRRLVERVAHHLEERLGRDQVAAHHGSLSRETRLSAEQRLKAGTLRCIVATASLELGIDVGDVELVVQVGSPRSIATLLQRIGRSGHSLGRTPKGRLFALTRDQLIECTALVRAVNARVLDALCIREAPLDVLAQQLVATCAAEEQTEDGLYAMVKRAYPYRNLSRESFDRVLEMLAEGVVGGKRRAEGYVHHDRIGRRVKARRHARLTAIMSGGAIPDRADYSVIAEPDETFVGTLDEDFAIESSAGDIFLLGNTSWRIRRVESGRVRVMDAAGAPPNVPFWRGEAPARTPELSHEVSLLREHVHARLVAGDPDVQIAADLAQEVRLHPRGAEQLVEYISATRNLLGAVPTEDVVIAERFFDEGGGMQLVIHAPFGARINRAWGLALRKRFCKSFNFELQAAATDDGILISLGPVHSFPLESVFDFVQPESVVAVLTQAVLQAPLFAVRWRWAAQRALAVPRNRGGKRVPAPILRMRTDDLLAGVFPMAAACQDNVKGDLELPDHPLVEEAMRDCLTEAMDVDGLIALLHRIRRGEVRLVAKDTAEPSPLAHELINANPYAYLDDAPLEERRARAVSMRRSLPPDVAEQLGALDPEAIASAVEEAAPIARDPDELYDALLSLGVWPAAEALARGLGASFEILVQTGRAARFVPDPIALPADDLASSACPPDAARANGNLLTRGRGLDDPRDAEGAVHTPGDAPVEHWVAAERAQVAEAAFGGGRFVPGRPTLPFAVPPAEPHVAQLSIVRGHLETSGPTTASALAARLGLPADAVEAALYALEAEGAVLRGRFNPNLPAHALEWCDRRILARIHRRTLGRLRKEIEAVTPADFMRFAFRWQHVAEGTQLHGVQGVLQVVSQLAGFELAAPAWELDVLPARVADFAPAHLDGLCLGGDVSWGRLGVRDGGDGSVITRAAPITLAPRSHLPWLLAEAPAEAPQLTRVARDVHAVLIARGASFLRDLAEATDHPARDVEDALRELIYVGLVTADGFAALRNLLGVGDGARNRSARDAPQFWAGPSPLDRLSGPRAFGIRAAASGSPQFGAGRFTLLRRDVSSPDAPSDPKRAEAYAGQLLLRYGVVFRDLLSRETHPPAWRDLLTVLRRMEARGELRGGRFVSGFVGEQYALPEAVDGLRAMRRLPADERVRISACDPLNLVGVVTPGPKVPAVAGNAVLYVGGIPVASREAGRIVPRGRLPEGTEVTFELQLVPTPTAAPPGDAATPVAQAGLRLDEGARPSTAHRAADHPARAVLVPEKLQTERVGSPRGGVPAEAGVARASVAAGPTVEGREVGGR